MNKAEIANNLFDAIVAANLADCGENDLPAHACRQDSTYGHLAEAIKSLGYEAEYWAWVETGDRPDIIDVDPAEYRGADYYND